MRWKLIEIHKNDEENSKKNNKEETIIHIKITLLNKLIYIYI